MSKVVSQRGVICSPHPQASAAGLAMLDQGGTAIDAMLAASATLAVVYPHMTGLGGDALWMISDGQRVETLVGIGQAGKRLPDGGKIHLRGPASAATTAGALRSWSLAKQLSSERWGSLLTWETLLAKAIEYAEDGMQISASQAFWQQQRKSLIAELPGLRSFCCDEEGRLLSEGSWVRQPRLAKTLKRLAVAGVDDFYQGEIGRSLAKGFAELGCGLTEQDLIATKAYLQDPIAIRYRKGTLYNVAPPTQGLYTLRALNMLNHVDIGGCENFGSDYYHYLVEAVKAMLLVRNKELCDPCSTHFEYRSQLQSEQSARDFASLDPVSAHPWREIGQPADTVWMAATDDKGRTACLIQSLFHDFGSGCFIGDTGVLWLNRAAGFNTDPGHVNCWAPAKRPAHTLNPSSYLADNGEQFFFGTQGGDGQPQTQMVLATQLIDYQQPIDRALFAPRFLLGRSFFDSTDNLKLESNIAKEVIEELEDRGHETEVISELSPYTGLAGAIAIYPDGVREAMYDPRGQGISLAQ
ncbi:gamma-glutamyltransferase family protein [Aestuariirhabdus sp. LZHN29]|uniref:gamma-glutamyltransferase family protein n=1 Tax=Aestuariirhabdus sp. LZHN29 TaxID=3417462 RepID=UPI003CE91C97